MGLSATDRPGILPAATAGISRRRQAAGAVLAAVGIPAVVVSLAPRRDDVLLSTPVLLVLGVVVATALVGGIRPAVPAAVGGFLLLNLVFTEPYGTFDVHRLDQGLALAVYTAVAVAVSVVVDLAARRQAQAARATAEAAELSRLAGARLGHEGTVGDVLDRVRDVFGLTSAAVLERTVAGWQPVEQSGDPDGASVVHIDLTERRALRVTGRPLEENDRRILTAFGQAAASALDGRRLLAQAARADRLATVDQLRTALLAGVGHDLRTPLAGIKAAVSSLRADDVQWTAAEQAELLGVVEDSADRLDALVANLLALSRLDAGVLSVHTTAVEVGEIVGRGLRGIRDADRLVVDLPACLPMVSADVGLAERVVANLVDNALQHSPRGTLVVLSAAEQRDDVVFSVADAGPGVPAAQREALFAPFQRIGDRVPGGLGLGLSVARGYTEAMGGRLEPADTPGGGLTMRIRLPRAAGAGAVG